MKALSSDVNEVNAVAQSNEELWEDYASSDEGLLQTLSSATQWGPLVSTQWDQGGFYNNYCPKKYGLRCAVGCTAVSIGQIANYWKYPASTTFSGGWWPDGDRYVLGGIDIDGDAAERHFPSFAELNSLLSSINYDGDHDEIGQLLFACGIKAQTEYDLGLPGFGGSGAYMKSGTYKKGLDYGSATLRSYHGVWPKYQNKVIENIQTGWPVQMGIYKSGDKAGHSVIVDGYKTTGEFHLNMGWGGGADNWYFLPDIDTSFLYPDFDTISSLIYDICPYEGWNQWGADEENTQSCIYGVPEDVDEINWDKWHRTTERSRYRFDGMVVGTGNKVYATVSPMDLGDGNPSYVYIINSYGEKVKDDIELSDAEYGLNYPAQLPEGYVFVTGGEGGLYRINPKTESVQKPYTLPAGYKFEDPLKFDEDGNLYAVAFQSLSPHTYRLYAFDDQGYARGYSWPFEAPSSCAIIHSPAIDSARNHVYVPYYNSSTETGYLTKLSRSTGGVEYTRSFSSLPAAYSTGPGTPSVGSDGTIYVGAYTTLYALDPDATLSVKWSKDLYPGIITRPPTIANEHLYVARWKEVVSSWKYVIEARRLSDGDVDWEIPFTLGSYDNISGQILAGSNGVIVFTIYKETPDTYTLYAYEDQGTTKTKLWEKEYPYGQAGDVALGPGNTLYVLGSERITAVSEGDRGDPDGAAMGFTDNAAPVMPFDPNPIDGANDVNLTVTLSWDCSDPEAHTLKYSLFVGESGYDMVPVDTNITSTSYELSGLKPATGYAWKILATDGQAISESPTWVFSTKPPNPDLSGDYFINFKDFSLLALHWMESCSEPNWCEGSDLNQDTIVDYNDLEIICRDWLKLTGLDDGLIAYWSFDEGAGSTVHDYSGNEINGEIYGDVNWIDGVSGKALDFNGVDGYVDFGNTVGNFGTEDFSVVFWFRTDTDRWETVMGKRVFCGEHSFFELQMSLPASPGRMYVELYEGFPSINGSFYSNQRLDDNQWHLLTITRKDIEGRLYIDGFLDASNSSAEVINMSNSASFLMGNGPCYPVHSDFFSGELDEVRIYNRALTAYEIQYLYENP